MQLYISKSWKPRNIGWNVDKNVAFGTWLIQSTLQTSFSDTNSLSKELPPSLIWNPQPSKIIFLFFQILLHFRQPITIPNLIIICFHCKQSLRQTEFLSGLLDVVFLLGVWWTVLFAWHRLVMELLHSLCGEILIPLKQWEHFLQSFLRLYNSDKRVKHVASNLREEKL